MIRNNFTLVEILMVLGLMAILLFIALPSFEKLAKGSGVELAARNLTSKLGQARGYAITSREYVAVLMPTTNTNSLLSTTPKLPEHAFKGYKLCVVSSTSTGTNPTKFTFKRWIPSENWNFLPNGTAINDIVSATAHTAGSDSTSWAANPLLEVVDNVNLTEIGHPDVDNVRAIVFRPTGKNAISPSLSRYIAVSESTFNGTDLTATNKKNWIDITVDQFTGRVTYGAE